MVLAIVLIVLAILLGLGGLLFGPDRQTRAAVGPGPASILMLVQCCCQVPTAPSVK